jgi:hypothetical protein
MHAEVMGNNNNVEKMLSPMPEGGRERERIGSPEKAGKRGGKPTYGRQKTGTPPPHHRWGWERKTRPQNIDSQLHKPDAHQGEGPIHDPENS